MGNSWLKLIFRQIEPLHIGTVGYGVIATTRLFIPGWTMWGALVNDWGHKNGGTNEVFKKGEKLFETITCFYPFLEENNQVLLPFYKHGRLFIGKYTEQEFRESYTETMVSTAIVPESSSAMDDSLHEIEVILPKKKQCGTPLFWIGYLKFEEHLKEYLKPGLTIFVGGERRYGFGRIQLKETEEATLDEISEWGLTDEGFWNSHSPLTNYLKVPPNCPKIEGRLERIYLRKFYCNSPKGIEAPFCFVPGSRLIDWAEKDKDIFFRLCKGVFKSKFLEGNCEIGGI